MGVVVDFFQKLYTEHLITTVIVVLLFCVLIVCGIILSQIAKSKNESKMYKENAENAINSLTPEEIDNISHNVADKEIFYELLQNNGQEKKETEIQKEKQNDKKIDNNIAESAKEDCEECNEKTPETKSSKQPSSKKNSTTQKSSKPKTNREYTGKWKIKKLDGKYFAELTASNGGTLLKTELYSTLSSLKNGIETLKKNIETGNIVITFDKNGHYRFKIFNNTNRLICISESYSSKAKCENGILSVKRFSKSDTIIIEDSIN